MHIRSDSIRRPNSVRRLLQYPEARRLRDINLRVLRLASSHEVRSVDSLYNGAISMIKHTKSTHASKSDAKYLSNVSQRLMTVDSIHLPADELCRNIEDAGSERQAGQYGWFAPNGYQPSLPFNPQLPPAIAPTAVEQFIPCGIKHEFPLSPAGVGDFDHPQLLIVGPLHATYSSEPPPPSFRPIAPDYNRPTKKRAEPFPLLHILAPPSSPAAGKQSNPAPTEPVHGQPLPRWSHQSAFGADLNQPRNYAFGGGGDDQDRAQYDDEMGKARNEEERWDERGKEERKRQQGGCYELKPDPALVGQAFFPVGDNRPQGLGFAQFDDELLRNVRNLDVPVLQGAVWMPNSDGQLSGGFGHVEKALWNNQDIGVKFLKGSTQTDSGMARDKESFLREIIAWSKLTHPNILPFLGVVCADKYLGMASPYMPNGSAPTYIAKHPDANVLQILCDVALGLGHLAAQSPPIAHGDLKGSNVLVDQNGRACICDFGLSKFIKDFKSIDTRRGGTIRWMAPEQILSETFLVSLSADIFSWGMLCFELMTGSAPWPEVQQDAAIVVKVAVRNQRPVRPTCRTRRSQIQPGRACLICNDKLWDLIQQCWLFEPDKRPTAAQLCEALAQEPTDKDRTQIPCR